MIPNENSSPASQVAPQGVKPHHSPLSQLFSLSASVPYPQPRHEAIRFRAEVMEPAESFDQTGFELTPVPLPADDQSGQQELFRDDCSQPDLSACSAQAVATE